MTVPANVSVSDNVAAQLEGAGTRPRPSERVRRPLLAEATTLSSPAHGRCLPPHRAPWAQTRFPLLVSRLRSCKIFGVCFRSSVLPAGAWARRGECGRHPTAWRETPPRPPTSPRKARLSVGQVPGLFIEGGPVSNKGPEACVPLSRSFQQLGKVCPVGRVRPTDRADPDGLRAQI